MNHIDILKRAFTITWRYRPLWVFGFFLALCGGGGSGVTSSAGGNNFNFPRSGGDSGGFEDFGNFPSFPSAPDIDVGVIGTLILGIICLIALLIIIAALIRAFTRTALIRMVSQITETETITIADGWRFGWSKGAWRLFLLGLVITIAFLAGAIILISLAFSPLFLLITENTALTIVGVIITIFAALFVFVLLTVVGVLIALFQEIAWRRIVLNDVGVIASFGDAISLIKRHLVDIGFIWLLILGAFTVWGLVAFIVLLPVALIAGTVVGGIPSLGIYLISGSVPGAAIVGVPLGLLILILVITAGASFYVVFQSAVWTLAYIEIQDLEQSEDQEITEADSGQTTSSLDLQPET